MLPEEPEILSTFQAFSWLKIQEIVAFHDRRLPISPLLAT